MVRFMYAREDVRSCVGGISIYYCVQSAVPSFFLTFCDAESFFIGLPAGNLHRCNPLMHKGWILFGMQLQAIGCPNDLWLRELLVQCNPWWQ